MAKDRFKGSGRALRASVRMRAGRGSIVVCMMLVDSRVRSISLPLS